MALKHPIESKRDAPAHARWRPARAISGVPDGVAHADERRAKRLGWLSIGLGVAETVMPGHVARLAGVPPRPGILRTFGMRELGSGLGILSERRPARWVWSRVAGDVLDLGALTAAFVSPRARRGRLVVATAAVAAISAVDLLYARRLSRARSAGTTETARGVKMRTSITINRSPDEIHRFWRDFGNLARVMRSIESVDVRGERRARWVARLPGGVRLEWDTEITDDRPGELIAWRSLPGGDVSTEGEVRFVPAPGGRGTEVHLDMTVEMPTALLSGAVSQLFGAAASTLASQDLRRLKQILETGEVPTP